MVKVFTGVLLEVTMVRVEDAPVAGLGLNVAVVPVGTPVALTGFAFVIGLLLLPLGEETKGKPLPA